MEQVKRMPLDQSPNDRTLLNVVALYEREIAGRRLTSNEIAQVADDAKRLVLDRIHTLKVRP